MSKDELTSFIEEVCGDSHLRVEDDLGDGFVRLRSSEAERRQAAHDIRSVEDIIIEMLRNSRDAHAHSIFVALLREGSRRKILFIDDGDGIPPAMHEKVFEPRVTSKLDSMHIDAWGVHGRGMALFAIKQNTENAFVAASDVGFGTALCVECSTEKLREKADQSSFPEFVINEKGALVVRGPRNINRVLAEFAFEHRGEVSVYCGSNTEIAATLKSFGDATLQKNLRTFCRNAEELPLCKRLSIASDPKDFTDLAKTLGLDISERSSRRIMDGEIRALDDVAELIKLQNHASQNPSSHATPKTKKKRGDARGLKIEEGDMSEFSDKITEAFDELAQKYYLESGVKPEMKLNHDGLRIHIPISKLR